NPPFTVQSAARFSSIDQSSGDRYPIPTGERLACGRDGSLLRPVDTLPDPRVRWAHPRGVAWREPRHVPPDCGIYAAVCGLYHVTVVNAAPARALPYGPGRAVDSARRALGRLLVPALLGVRHECRVHVVVHRLPVDDHLRDVLA